jgi:hypothetical protein
MSAAELILATGSAPAAPATGRVTLYADTDNKLYLKDAAGTAEQVGTGGASAPYLWRNTLLNGGFGIWQRQDPATATEYADDAYCADRWYVLTQSGPIDAQRIDGNTQRYAARLTQKQTTAQQLGLAQIIEGANCRHLRGQSVTFSARVRCSAACTARIAVLEWTGSEDTVTSDVVADWTNWTLAANVSAPGAIVSTSLSAATWAELEQTVTLGSTFTNLIVFVWTSALDASVTLDLEAAQFERGSAATPFEVRPVGAELVLCQRYFQLAPLPERLIAFRSSISGGSHYIRTQGSALAMPMRVVPTVTDSNPTWATTNPGANNEIAFYNDTAAVYTVATSFNGITAQVRGDAFSMYVSASSFDGGGGDLGLLFIGRGVGVYLSAEL